MLLEILDTLCNFSLIFFHIVVISVCIHIYKLCINIFQKVDILYQGLGLYQSKIFHREKDDKYLDATRLVFFSLICDHLISVELNLIA